MKIIPKMTETRVEIEIGIGLEKETDQEKDLEIGITVILTVHPGMIGTQKDQILDEVDDPNQMIVNQDLQKGVRIHHLDQVREIISKPKNFVYHRRLKNLI